MWSERRTVAGGRSGTDSIGSERERGGEGGRRCLSPDVQGDHGGRAPGLI